MPLDFVPQRLEPQVKLNPPKWVHYQRRSSNGGLLIKNDVDEWHPRLGWGFDLFCSLGLLTQTHNCSLNMLRAQPRLRLSSGPWVLDANIWPSNVGWKDGRVKERSKVAWLGWGWGHKHLFHAKLEHRPSSSFLMFPSPGAEAGVPGLYRRGSTTPSQPSSPTSFFYSCGPRNKQGMTWQRL